MEQDKASLWSGGKGGGRLLHHPRQKSPRFLPGTISALTTLSEQSRAEDRCLALTRPQQNKAYTTCPSSLRGGGCGAAREEGCSTIPSRAALGRSWPGSSEAGAPDRATLPPESGGGCARSRWSERSSDCQPETFAHETAPVFLVSFYCEVESFQILLGLMKLANLS